MTHSEIPCSNGQKAKITKGDLANGFVFHHPLFIHSQAEQIREALEIRWNAFDEFMKALEQIKNLDSGATAITADRDLSKVGAIAIEILEKYNKA